MNEDGHSKTLTFFTAQNQFEIELFSNESGYYARAFDMTAAGRIPLELHEPRISTIAPTDFYRRRRYYRNTFIEAIKKELTESTHRRKPVGIVLAQIFLRANLISYPNGYFDATEDNLDDLNHDIT